MKRWLNTTLWVAKVRVAWWRSRRWEWPWSTDLEHEAYMAMWTSGWPPALMDYVRSRPGALCGQAIYDAVGDWLKRKGDAPVPEMPEATK